MNPPRAADRRTAWAYWIACGLAVIAGLAPIALSHGLSSRVTVVILPFGFAAVLMAANALSYHMGRPISTMLFFVAGLAVGYGILASIAVPLRIEVIGSCPSPPAHCAAGMEPAIRAYESNSITFSVALGLFSIASAFVGLMFLFRRKREP